jgi:hypothetical protein
MQTMQQNVATRDVVFVYLFKSIIFPNDAVSCEQGDRIGGNFRHFGQFFTLDSF